jgi:thymidine phosphorylase
VIDPAAGIDNLVQAGERVQAGQPLMRLLAKDAALANPLVEAATNAVSITQNPVPPRQLLLKTL